MIRFSTLLKRGTAAIMLGSLLLLAGCHLGGTKGEVATAAMKSQFGVVIKSYKDGQFLVNGAVLSAIDAGSHFAYLKDQGRLPKTVLLEPSDSSKIRKVHLQYLARMQLDYGFRAYYDDKGVLVEINPKDTKARALEDHHERAPMRAAEARDHTGSPGGDGGP